MKTVFLDTLQKAINAYLNLDQHSFDRFEKLKDRVITIEFLPFHFTFQLAVTKSGITLYSGEDIPHDAKLTGTPLQMLGALINRNNPHAFFADDLKIEGDAAIARQITDLFDRLEIDWEEGLSNIVGDSASYHIMQNAKRLHSLFKETESRFTQDINEYLHEEINLFPEREALNDFFSDIDRLRMDVERLEARFANLHKVKPHENI